MKHLALRRAGLRALRSPLSKKPLSPKTRRRRRAGAIAAGVATCVGAPLLGVQMTLYRRNLAVARDVFQVAPPLSAHDRLLVLSPHCDDETLGAGGTIAAARALGVPVRIVFLTNGDGSRSTQISEDARRPADWVRQKNSLQQIALLRQREATRALNQLGVSASDIIFLGYPDGGTQKMWEQNWLGAPFRSGYTGANSVPYANARTPNAPYCGSAAFADVEGAIRDFRPTVVLTTHPNDAHPDHWAASAYAMASLEQLRLDPQTAWARETRLLTFLVHRGWWPAPHGYHPDAKMVPPAALEAGTSWMQAPLDANCRTAKKAALEQYQSQLPFTPNFLRAFLRQNELFGALPVNSFDLNSKLKTQNSKLLIQDPTRDSLLRDLWPAADLQGVWLVPSTAANTLTLRLQLARPASSRLQYNFALHPISAQHIGAWTAELKYRGTWRGLLHEVPSGAQRELAVRANGDGLDIDLPRDLLGLDAPASLLFSASSETGGTRLDETQTGILRVD